MQYFIVFLNKTCNKTTNNKFFNFLKFIIIDVAGNQHMRVVRIDCHRVGQFAGRKQHRGGECISNYSILFIKMCVFKFQKIFVCFSCIGLLMTYRSPFLFFSKK